MLTMMTSLLSFLLGVRGRKRRMIITLVLSAIAAIVAAIMLGGRMTTMMTSTNDMTTTTVTTMVDSSNHSSSPTISSFWGIIIMLEQTIFFPKLRISKGGEEEEKEELKWKKIPADETLLLKDSMDFTVSSSSSSSSTINFIESKMSKYRYYNILGDDDADDDENKGGEDEKDDNDDERNLRLSSILTNSNNNQISYGDNKIHHHSTSNSIHISGASTNSFSSLVSKWKNKDKDQPNLNFFNKAQEEGNDYDDHDHDVVDIVSSSNTISNYNYNHKRMDTKNTPYDLIEFNRLLQTNSGGGDGTSTASILPATCSSNISSDSFQTSYLLLLVGNETLITEQQVNLIVITFVTSYNNERTSGNGSSNTTCDPFFRTITAVNVSTDVSFNGVNKGQDLDNPLPMIPVRKLLSKQYPRPSYHNNKNRNGKEWKSSFLEFQQIMKNIEEEDENDKIKQPSSDWMMRGSQHHEQRRALQQQVNSSSLQEQLNTTSLDRFPDNSRYVLILLDIYGTCRACQGQTAAFDLFDDISSSSDAPVRHKGRRLAQEQEQRHLQEEEEDQVANDAAIDNNKNNDCLCPADSVPPAADSTVFQSSFNSKIDELRDSGEIEFVDEVNDVIPVLETTCPTKDQDFTTVYIVRDIVFSRNLLLSLGVEGAQEVERVFRNSYNSIANQLCDPLYRAASKVQLVSIDQEEGSTTKVKIEFVVEATCRGDDCINSGCIFDDGCGEEEEEEEERRERNLKANNVWHPQQDLSTSKDDIVAASFMADDIINSVNDNHNIRTSRLLQGGDNDDEDDDDKGAEEERCFCRKKRSNRSPTQKEVTTLFQSGLEQITKDNTYVSSVSPSVPPTSPPSNSASPSYSPSNPPTGSLHPSIRPTGRPTPSPSTSPSGQLSAPPTGEPTPKPSTSPSTTPSSPPSESTSPSGSPSVPPTGSPTPGPSTSPSMSPSAQPSVPPTGGPTPSPSMSPSSQPSVPPTGGPTSSPSTSPSAQPSVPPTRGPTAGPSSSPSEAPSNLPSQSPSAPPTTFGPSVSPSNHPSVQPTQAPSECLENIDVDIVAIVPQDGVELPEGAVTINEIGFDNVNFSIENLWAGDVVFVAVSYNDDVGSTVCDTRNFPVDYDAYCYCGYTDVGIYVYFGNFIDIPDDCDACIAPEPDCDHVAYYVELPCENPCPSRRRLEDISASPSSLPSAPPPSGRPSLAPIPSNDCPGDVELLAFVGDVDYPQIPIVVIDQLTTRVKFEVRNSFTETVSNLYVEFHGGLSGDPECYGESNVPRDESVVYTAVCMKNCPIAIVDIWVQDDSFDSSNNALVPECCTRFGGAGPGPTVQYTFKIYCEPGCR